MKKTVVEVRLTLAERSSARWLSVAVVAMLTIAGVALPATTAGASTATDPDFYDVTDLYGTTVIGPPLRFFLINEHFPAGAECQYQGSVGETELRCLFLATYFQDANLSCIRAADEAQLYPFNAVDLGEGGDCWIHTVDPSTMTSDARVRVLAEAEATGVDGREWVFDHWELTNAESPCENGLEHHDCTFDPVDGSQFEVHAFYRSLGSVAPQVTPHVTGTLGDAGWYTSDVGVSFTAVESNSDPLVLSDACDDSTAVTVDSAGQSVVCEAMGPGGTTTSTVVIMRDATQPVVDVTTVTDGATYLVGAVPAAGCAVSDVMSGPADTAPEPTGAGTTVGSHTVTCEGTDAAGNSATTQARYTVEEPPWHVNGFLEPVQSEIDVVNSVKGGKVVPLKFEIFEGTTEITELPDDLQLTLSRYACESTTDVTPVETADAGATALRYDVEEGVFIQNWKTPRTKGCYQVTLTLPAAGRPVVAHFLVR